MGVILGHFWAKWPKNVSRKNPILIDFLTSQNGPKWPHCLAGHHFSRNYFLVSLRAGILGKSRPQFTTVKGFSVTLFPFTWHRQVTVIRADQARLCRPHVTCRCQVGLKVGANGDLWHRHVHFWHVDSIWHGICHHLSMAPTLVVILWLGQNGQKWPCGYGDGFLA